MANANITIDVLNMDKAMKMRDALESLIAAASDYVKPRRDTDARQVLLERLDAAREALAQSEAQPVAWSKEEYAPSEPGWYAVQRADGSLCLRAFGKDERWWIPLKDGWFSGLPDGFSWFGPLEPVEWDTPAQQPQPVLDASWEQSTLRPQQAQAAEPAYVPLTNGDIDAVLDEWVVDPSNDYFALARAIEALVVARMRGEGK